MASVTGLGNTQSLHAAQGIKGITAVSAPVVKTVAAPQTHVPTEVGVKTPPPPAPRPEISSQSLADSTVGHLRTGGKATWALDDLGVGKDTREVTLGGVNFSATEMRDLTSWTPGQVNQAVAWKRADKLETATARAFDRAAEIRREHPDWSMDAIKKQLYRDFNPPPPEQTSKTAPTTLLATMDAPKPMETSSKLESSSPMAKILADAVAQSKAGAGANAVSAAPPVPAGAFPVDTQELARSIAHRAETGHKVHQALGDLGFKGHGGSQVAIGNAKFSAADVADLSTFLPAQVVHSKEYMKGGNVQGALAKALERAGQLKSEHPEWDNRTLKSTMMKEFSNGPAVETPAPTFKLQFTPPTFTPPTNFSPAGFTTPPKVTVQPGVVNAAGDGAATAGFRVDTHELSKAITSRVESGHKLNQVLGDLGFKGHGGSPITFGGSKFTASDVTDLATFLPGQVVHSKEFMKDTDMQGALSKALDRAGQLKKENPDWDARTLKATLMKEFSNGPGAPAASPAPTTPAPSFTIPEFKFTPATPTTFPPGGGNQPFAMESGKLSTAIAARLESGGNPRLVLSDLGFQGHGGSPIGLGGSTFSAGEVGDLASWLPAQVVHSPAYKEDKNLEGAISKALDRAGQLRQENPAWDMRVLRNTLASELRG